MTDTAGDESGDDRFQLRRHLSVIQAQTECFLDETERSAIEREGLERIRESCRELTALVEGQTEADTPRLLPESATPATVDRVVIYTEDEYLSAVLDTRPDPHAGVDIVHVTDETGLESAVTDAVDWLLVDAVRPDGTGLDVIGDLGIERPAYALVSLYSDRRTPVSIACSGLLSPAAEATTIDDALRTASDTAEPTAAGFLTDQPKSALRDRLGSETAIDSAAALTAKIEDAKIEADCICLDPAVYRRLPSHVVDRLRTPQAGDSRPIVLVAPTDGDPYDRSWIPTLGSQRFRAVAPELDGLITQLLVQRPEQPDLPT